MQPRRLLFPLLLTVFHVTKSGYSEVEEGSGFPCLRRRLPSEKNDDRDEEDFEVAEVADEFAVAIEEFVEGSDEDDEDWGLGASKRLIAAGLTDSV